MTTKLAFNQIDGNTINVKDYGAVGDGVTDDLVAINNAISSAGQGGTVVFPKGTYAVSGTIVVGYQRTIILNDGVTVKITTALTSSDVPVFFMNGSRSNIIGAGYENSVISTENKCPDGIVKLGAQSMSVQTGNVEKCSIRHVRLTGQQLYGQTSGDPDVCLHMPSPELSTYFNYFHTIEGVFVEDANIGIWYRGWANGIYAKNLYGVHLGNTTHEAANNYRNCFILMSGCLDNMITDCFFNQSNDITGLIVEQLDNRSNGSPSIMTPQYNTIKGQVYEQGGTTTNYAMRVTSSAASFYEIRTNNFNGWQVPSTFVSDGNHFFSSTSASIAKTNTDVLTATDNSFVGKTSYDISTTGVQLAADGITGFTTDDNTVAIFNRLTDSGTTNNYITQYRVDGTYHGSISAGATDRLALASASDGIGFDASTSVVGPMNDANSFLDNTMSCGGSGARWTEVWAVNGTINTSDERDKTFFDIEEAEINAARDLKQQIRKYKWKDSPDSKYHFGVGAQSVVSVMESYGLVVSDYSFISYEDDKYGIRYSQLLAFIISAL